jgi:CBS domain-containing protein
MQFYAKDIMSTHLVTVRPEMTAREAMELFTVNRISGAPVVDGSGRLKGVITASDILRASLEWPDPMSSYFLREPILEEELSRHGFHLEHINEDLVDNLMSREVFKAHPDTPVADLALKMFKARIHRVIVVDPSDQAPQGVVTTFDLLKLLAEGYSIQEFLEDAEGWLGEPRSYTR